MAVVELFTKSEQGQGGGRGGQCDGTSKARSSRLMALQLQMTWQPSLLSAKRKTGPPLGLKNLGNTCYLNSVLQCLTYTPPLANFCLRNQHSSLCDSVRDCPFCLLEKRIVRSLRYDGVLDVPLKFQSSLKIFAEHFPGGRQEDAHEFLRYVIDACHNTCLRLKKLKIKGAVEVSNGSSSGGVGGSTTTVVEEIFGGALQSQVKCLSCGYESNKVDEIMDISLDVLHSNSLEEAMQKFFQPQVLDGNNKYKCEKCKKLVAARKQMSILQAPNILVIQLKRFEGIFGGKIDKPVAFEEVLVLSNFMCKESQDPQPEYKLFGTIVHSGYSPESGHYYAYIKDATGSWYCCNDSMVKHTLFQTVLSEKVYILFFTRVNKRLISVSPSLASKGEKSYTCNGDKFHGSPMDDLAMRNVHSKGVVEKPYLSDIPDMAKNEKDPSCPKVKFDFAGNSISRKGSVIVNGRVDTVKGQSLATTSLRNSSTMRDKGKDQTSLVKGNGFHQNGKAKVDAFGEKHLAMENGNGYAEYNHVNGVKSDGREVSSSRNELMTGGACNHHKLETNGCRSESKANMPRNKRKVEENTSILLAEDSLSRREVEKLKDLLRKEAYSVLQSCGWSDEVYKFMWSRKRFCTREGAKESINDDLKKKLIQDAKGTFNSQIPESLKEDLIGRLRTFKQENKQFSGN